MMSKKVISFIYEKIYFGDRVPLTVDKNLRLKVLINFVLKKKSFCDSDMGLIEIIYYHIISVKAVLL